MNLNKIISYSAARRSRRPHREDRESEIRIKTEASELIRRAHCAFIADEPSNVNVLDNSFSNYAMEVHARRLASSNAARVSKKTRTMLI